MCASACVCGFEMISMQELNSKHHDLAVKSQLLLPSETVQFIGWSNELHGQAHKEPYITCDTQNPHRADPGKCCTTCLSKTLAKTSQLTQLMIHICALICISPFSVGRLMLHFFNTGSSMSTRFTNTFRQSINYISTLHRYNVQMFTMQ